VQAEMPHILEPARTVKVVNAPGPLDHVGHAHHAVQGQSQIPDPFVPAAIRRHNLDHGLHLLIGQGVESQAHEIVPVQGHACSHQAQVVEMRMVVVDMFRNFHPGVFAVEKSGLLDHPALHSRF
jgi:hypothetical protein